MTSLDEILYGWGVYPIGMPRDTCRIPSEANIPVFRQTISSTISGLMTHDLPWHQVFFVTVIAALLFLSAFSLSKRIPKHSNQPPSQTSDIVITVIHDKYEPESTVSEPTKLHATWNDARKETVITEDVTKKTEAKPIVQGISRGRKQITTIQRKRPHQPRVLPTSRDILRTDEMSAPNVSSDISWSSTLENQTGSVQVEIPEQVISKRSYTIRQEKEDSRSPRPTSLTDSFEKKSTIPKLAYPGSLSGRVYKTETLDQEMTTASYRMSGSGKRYFAGSANTDKTAIPQLNKKGQRYDLEKATRVDQSLLFPHIERKSRSFQSKKVETYLTPSNFLDERSFSTEKPAIKNDTGDQKYYLDLSHSSTMKTIDSSLLISLSELSVCTDPEEEFRLKTILATLLTGPTQFAVNGMLIYVKYPKSAYTIDISLYNPERKFVQNRCEILNLIVDHIRNSIN